MAIGIAARVSGAVAAVVLVASCAGGGGGGSNSTTNNSGPPPTTTTAFSFTPPDPATSGSNTAVAPTLGSTPVNVGTFPLKETVVTAAPTSIGPDVVTESAGATLSVISFDPLGSGQFRLQIPGLGIDDTFASSTLFKGTGTPAVTPTLVTTSDLILNASSLNSVTFGVWATSASSTTTHFGAFVTGYELSPTATPVSGTADYNGTKNVTGLVAAGGSSGSSLATLSGDASVHVDFNTRAVTGTFTNMTATPTGGAATPWNDVSVNASLISGTSHFSGTTAATSAPATAFSVSGSATGNVNGGLYRAGDQIGGVWSLSSGNTAAIGAFGGDCACGGSSGGTGGGIVVGGGGGGIVVVSSHSP